MTVGMEFNIWRDRLSKLTVNEINASPTPQLSVKIVSPITDMPHMRGPFSSRSNKPEPTIRAAITRRRAMRLFDRIRSSSMMLTSCLLAICDVGPEADNFLRPAISFPQDACLILHPKVAAVFGPEPVFLHQVPLGHQDRCFLVNSLPVIWMQAVNPPARSQRFPGVIAQNPLNAVAYPFAAKAAGCYRKHVNDGRDGVQYMAGSHRRYRKSAMRQAL